MLKTILHILTDKLSLKRHRHLCYHDIKQLVLSVISEQMEREKRPGNYDVKSSLYALSSLYAKIESARPPDRQSGEQAVQFYIELMSEYQQHYRQQPLDSDEYGGGAASIGSVIQQVIAKAQIQEFQKHK